MRGLRFIGLEPGDTRERLFALLGTPPPDRIRVNEETKRVLICFRMQGACSESIGVICDAESERITYISVLADAEGDGRALKEFLAARGVFEPLLDFIGKRPRDLMEAFGTPAGGPPESAYRYERSGSTLAFETFEPGGGRIHRISVYWHDPHA
jgi:hypothetical protein